MKILVLKGSPRPNGNTAGMVKTFQQAAVEHGHQVKVFNVCKMNINGWFYKNRREKLEEGTTEYLILLRREV